MPRDISPALITASEAPVVEPLYLVKLEYDSGTIRVHSGVGPVTFQSELYLGVGQYGRISGISEDTELSANFLDLQLSGIDPSLLSIQLNEAFQGNPATVFQGFRDIDTKTLIDAYPAFKGLMDNSTISIGQTGTISLRINNRMARWDKSNERRYNNADQQARFPGDLALEFQEKQLEEQLPWGVG